MSADYYEDPLLLFQGLMPDANAISASAAVGIFYTSDALQTGGSTLRPPSVILTEVVIASSHTATATIGLFLAKTGASVSAGCAVFPDVDIDPASFTRITLATIMPAGSSLRGRSSINNKVCLHISGVKRTPRTP